jgi:AcrR family transcriptional regulator
MGPISVGSRVSAVLADRQGSPPSASNAHLREEVDSDGSINAVGAWAWRGLDSGHLFWVGVQYSNGRTRQFVCGAPRNLGIRFDSADMTDQSVLKSRLRCANILTDWSVSVFQISLEVFVNTIKNTRKRPVDEELWGRRTDEILDVAATLFAERGYAGADTQELAERVSVGKGTLYRYFPSKRDLFLAAADRAMRRLREYLDAAMSTRDDPLEQIVAAIEAFLGFFDEHPEFAELLILERALFRDRNKPTYIEHREKNVGRWRQLYQALIEAGRVRAMPVHRITSVISDLVYGTMFTNHVAGRQKALREQADDIVEIVFCGILSDSERRLREVNR